MVWIWTTHFEMHFVSSLAVEGFDQHMLRCILCPRWHGKGLVNRCCYTFCVVAGMGWVWSTHVEIHVESSLAWDGFGQNMVSKTS
jgi:hypothetical protein